MRALQTFTALQASSGMPLVLPASLCPYDRTVEVLAGSEVLFSTLVIDGARGKVLEIDHGAAYPIKIQWAASQIGDVITNFHPDEFTTIKVLS